MQFRRKEGSGLVFDRQIYGCSTGTKWLIFMLHKKNQIFVPSTFSTFSCSIFVLLKSRNIRNHKFPCCPVEVSSHAMNA
jgi:hypothetical protein